MIRSFFNLFQFQAHLHALPHTMELIQRNFAMLLHKLKINHKDRAVAKMVNESTSDCGDCWRAESEE